MGQDSDHHDPAWAVSDAWILAAVARSGSRTGQSLVRVIASADAINHCVLTEPEFALGIGRLLAAGLVGADPDGDRYWPTDEGLKISERWKSGMFEWANAILPQLQRLGRPHDHGWSLPAGRFDQAIRDYLTR